MKIYTAKELLLTATHLSVPFITFGYSAWHFSSPFMATCVIGVAGAVFYAFNKLNDMIVRHDAKKEQKPAPKNLSKKFNELISFLDSLKDQFNFTSATMELKNNADFNPSMCVDSSKNKIHITTSNSMLKRSSLAELKGIVAHEVGHALTRCTEIRLIGRLASWSTPLLCGLQILKDANNYDIFIVSGLCAFAATEITMNSLNRIQEYQADRIACEITNDPQSMINWFNRMSFRERGTPRDPFNSLTYSHPFLTQRAKRLEKTFQHQSLKPG